MSEPRQLPPFPVDDVTLDLIDHSLNACIDTDDGGGHVVVGADMTLDDLLVFLSGGMDPERSAVVEAGHPVMGGWEGAEVRVFFDARYSDKDAMRALIGEVRRLRALIDLDYCPTCAGPCGGPHTAEDD